MMMMMKALSDIKIDSLVHGGGRGRGHAVALALAHVHVVLASPHQLLPLGVFLLEKKVTLQLRVFRKKLGNLHKMNLRGQSLTRVFIFRLSRYCHHEDQEGHPHCDGHDGDC